ncbi:MAG: substrate-binding periplasmic protein [Desulfovibrionaceae bacterium]
MHVWSARLGSALTWTVVVCLVALALPAWGEDVAVRVTMHYHPRVPYMYMTDAGMAGLTGAPAARAFEAADIPVDWVETPAPRQLMMIQANTGLDCGLGWFRNAERARFARFTVPLYQDRPAVALMRADNPRIDPALTLDGLLRDRALTLLVKSGYSYGAFLDAAIRREGPNTHEVTGDNLTMLRLIHMGRADYFFVSPEEAANLIDSAGLPQVDFRLMFLEGVPYGEKRYIMCSRQVPRQVIDKLNAVLPPLDSP